MTMNPADEAAENYKGEMDKLRAEVTTTFIHRLKKTLSSVIHKFNGPEKIFIFIPVTRLSGSSERFAKWKTNTRI